MTHNPKLNVYVLRLKPKDESVVTFRDLIKCKYHLDEEDDKIIFKKYFEEFLNEIGMEEFVKDEKEKKVFGVYKSSDGVNYSITPKIDKNIIKGTLDGGKYGISRETADIDLKEDKQKLSSNKAVLDKFYFLLSTPLNSNYGFLLIQSYTEETIQSPFKNKIQNYFAVNQFFYNPIIEPYVPIKFIEKFKQNAKIRMFSFSSLIGMSEQLREKNINFEDGSFEVEIKIKPKADIKPTPRIINRIISFFNDKKFDDKGLDDFNSKIFIQNGKRKANFDIEKEISSIKPTIYLDEEGIKIDTATGVPDFNQIDEYCLNLLDEVAEEYIKILKIDEH